MKTLARFASNLKLQVAVIILCGAACAVFAQKELRLSGPESATAALALMTLMSVPLLPFARSVICAIVPALRRLEFPASAEFDPLAFSQFLVDLRAQINAVLQGMPPLEQFEASAELSYGLRSLQNTAASLMEMAEGLGAQMTKYTAALKTGAEAVAETALIAKGEYVKKTDAETAQTAAVAAKEAEVKASLQTAQTEQTEGEARRTKLVADKITTAVVAGALPIEFFKVDGYEGRIVKLAARLKKLTDAKLVAEPFVAEMVAIPLDDAGDKTFEARVTSVKSLISVTATRGSGGSAAASASLALPNAETEDAGALEYVF